MPSRVDPPSGRDFPPPARCEVSYLYHPQWVVGRGLVRTHMYQRRVRTGSPYLGNITFAVTTLLWGSLFTCWFHMFTVDEKKDTKKWMTRAAVSNEYEAVSAFGNLAPSASLVIPKLARPELAYLWSSTTSLKSPSGVVLTKFIISLKFSSAYTHPLLHHLWTIDQWSFKNEKLSQSDNSECSNWSRSCPRATLEKVNCEQGSAEHLRL